MATGIMGDASHVLRISRRWRSCSSTVKIPSTARSADSDLSGQKCSTSAVGSDASAGLSQERIWSPRKLRKKPSPVVQRAGLPDGERPINAWRTASCRAAISPITWNTCDVEHPSQGKSSIRARAPLRWPFGCVSRPAACGGDLCSRVASHATQTRCCSDGWWRPGAVVAAKRSLAVDADAQHAPTATGARACVRFV